MGNGGGGEEGLSPLKKTGGSKFHMVWCGSYFI